MTSPITDQKKRALEALERRFAFDKAKIIQQEEQNSKSARRNPNEQLSLVLNYRNSITDLATKLDRTLSSSSRKAQVVFSGHTTRWETFGVSVEDAHPAYSENFEILDDNLVGNAAKASNRGDIVDRVAFDLLQHGDKGHRYTKGSIAMKIDNWVLLDNFVPKDGVLTNARVRALKSHSKRSKKHMSLWQHRNRGSFDFPTEYH